MTPTKPTGTIQAQILEQLTELKGKVEESLQQGRENNSELKMLRRELGLDGQHGRLPNAEATLIRHEARISTLETESSEARGKSRLLGASMSILGGGAGGALIAIFDRLLRSR